MGTTARLVCRKMTVDDAEAAAALDLKSFGEVDAWSADYFFYAAQNERAEFLIVEEHGKIIACAGADIFADAAEIVSFAVDPDRRNQGIGTKLLETLIETVKKRGATVFILEVRPSNKIAIKLYEKFGFEIVDREENYYYDEDAWIMAKEIL
ncbi:MAG: ribosomal protein S18-alanine N-acetyltransferase [Selenomonadaceae bacterium]|nr:ribosomal protein S18-alanine N-acetyltransferase [Selenomonadaceae bacterium]